MSITPERKAYLKEYYKKNKERIRAYQAEWVKNNPDRFKASQKKYREEHREEIQVRQRESRERLTQSSPEKFLTKKLQRIVKKEQTCRESARDKFQLCDLNIEYLMKMWKTQKGRCALTKKKMTHKFHCLFAASIDRIESEKGYVQGNVQLVCQAVNYAKNKFTNEEFLSFWINEEKQNG